LVYACGAVMLGAWLLYHSIQAAVSKTQRQAQRLLIASVLYLPVLLGLMVLDRH
jgi:heme O synthase-like polyprenyltransferase